MEALLIGATIAIVGAVIGVLGSWRMGLHPVQAALVSALKDRVALLEKENVELKAEVASLTAENLRLEARVEKLEKLITDGLLAKTVTVAAV